MTSKTESIDLQIAIGMQIMDERADILQALADNPIDHSKELQEELDIGDAFMRKNSGVFKALAK